METNEYQNLACPKCDKQGHFKLSTGFCMTGSPTAKGYCSISSHSHLYCGWCGKGSVIGNDVIAASNIPTPAQPEIESEPTPVVPTIQEVKEVLSPSQVKVTKRGLKLETK